MAKKRTRDDVRFEDIRRTLPGDILSIEPVPDGITLRIKLRKSAVIHRQQILDLGGSVCVFARDDSMYLFMDKPYLVDHVARQSQNKHLSETHEKILDVEETEDDRVIVKTLWTTEIRNLGEWFRETHKIYAQGNSIVILHG